MTGSVMRLKVKFRSCRRSSQPREDPRQRAYRLARQIALGHFIEEQVENGELASYAEAAQRLGLTRARLSQVLDLVLLAPAIQEAVVSERVQVSARGARSACSVCEWTAQIAVIDKACALWAKCSRKPLASLAPGEQRFACRADGR